MNSIQKLKWWPRIGSQRAVFALLVALLAMVGMAAFVLASDVSDAIWRGEITVTNNGTNAAAVSVNMSLSSASLVENSYASADLTDIAIQLNGVDTAFMPSVNSTYPWAIWVPSIGVSQNVNYDLYSGDVTGGKIRYFPGSGGMASLDTTSLEPGANFTVELKGWVDTSSGLDKYLVNKLGAFQIFINGDGNIISIIGSTNQTEYLIPNSAGDLTQISNSTGGENYQNMDDPVGVPDDGATELWTSTDAIETDFYNIQNTALTASDSVDNITVFFRVKDNSTNSFATPLLLLDSVNTTGTRIALANGVWASHTEILDRPGGGSWTASDLDDLQVGLTLQYTPAGNSAFATQIYVMVSYRTGVVTTGVSSGEHTVVTAMESPFLGIGIDAGNDFLPVSDNLVLNAPLWQPETDNATFTTIDSYGHTCTVTGATFTPNVGRIFDGTNDKIDCGNAAILQLTNNFTIETWVNVPVFGSYETLVDKMLIAGNRYSGWGIHRWNDNKFMVFVSSNVSDSNYAFLFSDSAYAAEGWHLLHFVRSSGTNSLSVDGVEQADTNTHAMTDGAINLVIGQGTYIGYGQSVIGEHRIYNRVLTPAERLQNYNATKGKYGIDSDISIYSTLTGVPDNSNDWVFLQNDVLPYMEYQDISVNGTQVQYIDWEYGTTFSDTSGYGNDATPTFRTTSSDADVSAVLSTFEPVDEAELDTFTLVDSYSILTENATLPAGTYDELDVSKIPGGAAANELLAEGDIPQAAWWLPFIFLGICVVGLIMYGATTLNRSGFRGRLAEGKVDGSLLMMFVIMEVPLVVFGIMGVIPKWPFMIFPIAGVAIIISRKHYSWG